MFPTDRLAARFTPVPVRPRADGWTAARQRGFVTALGRGLSVQGAAAAVGMSREGAYRLADRPHSRSFRRAWRVAQGLARPLPPPREDLWGDHVHDRRKRGLARRPISDGRLRCALRHLLTREAARARAPAPTGSSPGGRRESPIRAEGRWPTVAGPL